MGYERYPRNTNPQRDYCGRQDPQDYSRDYGSGRDYSYSSARDYRAAGDSGDDRDRGDFGPYRQREYGNAGYEQKRSYRGYGQPGQGQSGRSGEYHGSYASDGRRFEDVEGRRDWDDDDRGGGNRFRSSGGYGRQPRGYDYDDRGFFARAGDEVRSWFGDEDAERRREADTRHDERSYGDRWSNERDGDYHGWRRNQIAALDRDYDEYRKENRSKFENEFSSWRTSRQSQRDQLGRVEDHMDVVGSDGTHVGTVDKVRGDRILLTKSDADAYGRHHSIPSRWIDQVDSKVTLTKSAEDAQSHWRDEERNQAMFGDETGADRDPQGRMLNRSFSGTY